MRYILLLVLLFLVPGCEDPVQPDPLERPVGAEPVEPLPEWAEWYAGMEKCAGIRGDFDAVNWYVIPEAVTVREADGHNVPAEYWPPNDIYVAGKWAEWAVIIEHESLHHIEQDTGHPQPPFGKCSPVSR